MVVLPEMRVYATNDSNWGPYVFKAGVWRFPQVFDKFSSKPDIRGKSNYGLKQLKCAGGIALRLLEAQCELQIEWKKVATCSPAGDQNETCSGGIPYKFGMDYDEQSVPEWITVADESGARRVKRFINSMFLRANFPEERQ